MNEYYVVIGGRLALPPNLREEPKREDFYIPSKDKQKLEKFYHRVRHGSRRVSELRIIETKLKIKV